MYMKLKETERISEQEWEKIVEDAFHDDAPIHEFSKSYLIRKEKMMAKTNKRSKILWRTVAVLAAAAVLPTAAYAAGSWYAGAKQTNTYEQTVQITADSSTVCGYKALNIENIPEDLQLDEDGKYRGRENEGRAMTVMFMRAPKDGIEEVVPYQLSSRTFETEAGDTAIFIKRDRGYDQIWVAFKDTPYVAMAYVNGFTDDEVNDLANGFILEDSAVEIAWEWEKPETGIVVDNPEKFSEDIAQMVKVGESYQSVYSENRITLDRVWVQENFEGLTRDGINRPADYSEYLAEDGTIRTARQMIAKGDGVTKLDEVVSTDEMTQKVVVLEMTVKNESNELQGEGFCPKLFYADEEGNTTDTYNMTPDGSLVCTHEKTGDLMYDGLHFSFETEKAGSKNSIGELKPGEEAKVKLAFLVDADMTEHLYVELDPQYDNGKIFTGSPVLSLSEYF